MKRILFVCLPLLTVACAKPRATAKTSAANATSLSPAQAQGLWADKASVQQYRATGKISAKDCSDSTEQGEPSVDILKFGADNVVGNYDPSQAATEKNNEFVYRNGVLEKPEQLPGSNFSLTMARSGNDGVRMHLRNKDPSTGKAITDDEELVRVTTSEAADLLAQEYNCVRLPIPGRITDVPVGTGHLAISGAISREETYSSTNKISVSCGSLTAVSKSGKKDLYIGSVTDSATKAGEENQNGLWLEFAPDSKLDGSSQTVAIPAQGDNGPSINLTFLDDPSGSYSGDCTLQLNQASHVLETKLHCDAVKRTDTNTGETKLGALDASLACNNDESSN